MRILQTRACDIFGLARGTLRHRSHFDENFQRSNVDGRPKDIKIYAFLNENIG